MPRIFSDSLAAHHDVVWAQLTDAWETLLAQKSYDEISLTELAAAAGMARNTLYNYAPDKAALLTNAARHSSRQLLGHVVEIAKSAEPETARMERMVAAILNWIGSGSHRHLIAQTLFVSAPSETQEQASAPLLEVNAHFARVLAEGIRAGSFRSLEDIDLTVELMAGVVERAARQVAKAPARQKPVLAEVQTFLSLALNKT